MYVSSMHILSTHGHVHGLVHPINIYLSTIPFHHRATLYTYPIADNFPHWKLCNDKQIYTHAHVHTHLQDPNSTHLWNFMNMLPVDIKVQKFVLRFCFRVSTRTLYLVLCCNLLLHFCIFLYMLWHSHSTESRPWTLTTCECSPTTPICRATTSLHWASMRRPTGRTRMTTC